MRLLTDQVITAVATAGFDVGDAEALDTFDLPYSVVYPLFVAELDGPMNDTTADGWWEYQVTAVGQTREQAEGLAEAIEPLILATTFTVSGYVLGPVVRSDTIPVERDDDVQPPLFYQTKMYRIWVTPT